MVGFEKQPGATPWPAYPHDKEKVTPECYLPVLLPALGYSQRGWGPISLTVQPPPFPTEAKMAS